jgi:hypothetical protein
MRRNTWLALAWASSVAVLLTVVTSAPAGANNGDPLIVGTNNYESTNTALYDSASSGIVLLASGANTGLDGIGAVYGVTGGSSTGTGVQGTGTTNGVDGTSSGGNGVYGHVNNQATSGVYGQNANTSGGYGVAGRSSAGPLGAQVGAGVLGENTSTGVGVWGHAVNGTGVYADSPSGYALQVNGKATFSRSGVVSVAGTSTAPKNSVRVTLPVTSRSMMIATLQKFVSGVFVVAAVPNVTGGYFTIYLNKSVTTTVGPIAWQVIEKP